MIEEPFIVCNDNTITKEDLPFPIVLYPGFYGAYFGFKKDFSSEIYFCSCARKSIENFITYKLKNKSKYADPERNFILDSMYFPLEFTKQLLNEKLTQDSSIINKIKFKENLCHECNKVTPRNLYCLPMYGGQFMQHYGWYVNKEAFENGVEPINYDVFISCPQKEIEDLIKISPKELEINSPLSTEEEKIYFEKRKIFNKQKRKVHNVIENKVRQKYGFKNVGEAWTNETLVYYIINQIFPDDKIFFHFRPKWLEGIRARLN